LYGSSAYPATGEAQTFVQEIPGTASHPL
jgi:hypothetical protein